MRDLFDGWRFTTFRASSPILQIRLLGEFFLTDSSKQAIRLATERSQALLAFLVLHRHTPQLRSRLAFYFWADSTDAQARTNLRKELFYLRHALPNVEQFLLADAKTLQWRPDAPFTLDVASFEDAIQVAERSTNSDSRRVALEKAVELYRGDLLPKCDQDWIVPERERLQQLCILALEELTQLLEAQQDYRAAIRYAQELLRIEPLNEATYGQLMRLYAQVGARGSALRIYHRCLTVWREELGVNPSAAIRELYEYLLKLDEQSEPLSAPQEALERTVADRGTDRFMPRQDWGEAIDVSIFYGREAELAKLQQWVVEDRCRLIALLGMGGIGKTAIAVKLAREIMELNNVDCQSPFQFVIWRSLRNAPPLETFLTDLVSFLSDQQDTHSELGRLVHWLRANRCLVILDTER